MKFGAQLVEILKINEKKRIKKNKIKFHNTCIGTFYSDKSFVISNVYIILNR